MWILKHLVYRVQGILAREIHLFRRKEINCTPDGPEKSALENFAAEVLQLPIDVRGMRLDAKKVSLKSVKLNATVEEKDDEIHGGNVRLETLIVLEGSLNEKRVRVLKRDGCNTNAVSREFLKNNRELFEVVKRPVEVMQSEENAVEKISEVILGAELRIGTHFLRLTGY